jgi:hypothetical protein
MTGRARDRARCCAGTRLSWADGGAVRGPDRRLPLDCLPLGAVGRRSKRRAFSLRLLELAGDRERQLSAPNHRQLAQQIRVGVAVRGGLYGLCLLLASVFSPAAREDREGRLLAAAGRHNDRAGARRSRQGGITWGE